MATWPRSAALFNRVSNIRQGSRWGVAVIHDRRRNAICRCLIYALQNIYSGDNRCRGPWGIRRGRGSGPTWVLFKVLLIWTRGHWGGEGVNRALTVANDTWRHVPSPRCAFRGPRVPTNLSSTWRESKSRGTNFEKIIYLVSFSRELFLTRKKGKCIGEEVFFVSNFIKCKKQLKKDHFVGRRTALENKRNNRWYFFPLLLHLI